MAEKTEKATPKKLRDARKKGQVAKSQDFPSAFTFIVAISSTLIFANYIYDIIANFFLFCIKLVPYIVTTSRSSSHIELRNAIGGIFKMAMQQLLMASLPIAVAVSIVGVIVNFLVIGPVFSVEVFKPDIKKFNPITGIKNKFKMKTLFELLKSVFKLTVAALLIVSVMWASLNEIVATAGLTLWETTAVFASFLVKVIIRIGLFFIFIAVIDLIYQKRQFAKEMKMEKHELKQEYKNTEGDPQIKSKRRQIAQEIAYEEGPSAVKRAKAVVTNPAHIAVAIGYEPTKYAAPYIVFMGMDLLARKMIEVADRNDIPIMRNVGLAHQLFDEGEINKYIPEATYEAVAEVLRWIAALDKEKELE
ncbi:type III secretion system export apparatus subunit SctU [Simkania negevensis]|uniref:Type III secretion system export apparatus subunit SctU n=1 Tax=Simkania negevensis TaxID=83561 RepID=A0ABS3ARF3_9BACT|nr:type III secretion system export apparatus subunit SctU [Simkania negevensis]